MRSSMVAITLAVLILCILFLIVLHTIYRPPAFLINYFQRRWPDVLFHVNTKQKLVALTIDDVPSEHTQHLLEILQANNATATFFIIGSQVISHGHTLVDIIDAGNELGNHAMYDEPSRSLSDPQLRSQISAVEEMIGHAYAACNKEMSRFFRPGSGFFSTRMRVEVRSMGYRMVLGDIYPHDPQIPFWRINAWHILSMLQPGAIIVCHDRRSWTAPMLQKVLPEVRRRGYRVVTITELLKAQESSD